MQPSLTAVAADAHAAVGLPQPDTLRRPSHAWLLVLLAASWGLVLLGTVLVYQQRAGQRALEAQLKRLEKAVAAIQTEIRSLPRDHAQVITGGPLDVRITAPQVRVFVNPPVATTAETRPAAAWSIADAADITRGNPERKAVSFTFDGGSEANAAEEILAILRERGVRTTLFLTGEFLRNFPEIVQTALADGHEIGNHTFHHPHLTSFAQNGRHDRLPSITKERLQKELLDTAALFTEITGRSMAPYWRAPYGEVNTELRRWAEEVGFRHVGWTNVPGFGSLDSLDWVEDPQSPLYRSGDALRRHFTRLLATQPRLVQGGIFLMHLGTERKDDKIHWQLAAILDAYRQHGFEIVPVTQLLQ